MTSLPVLLKKLEALLRQHVDIEHQIASVKREISSVGKAEPKRRRKRSTSAETVELVKATVRVLQAAGEPLPRREIAARLGIAPSAVSYRLQKAVAMKFAEKVNGGRYRASADVPVL